MSNSSSPRPGASRGAGGVDNRYGIIAASSLSESQCDYYGTAAEELSRRRIAAVETTYVSSFHGGGSRHEEGPRAVQALASELVLRTDNTPCTMNEKDVSACGSDLLKVLSGPYETEGQFSTAMFHAMAEGLRRLAPWTGVLLFETKIILTQVNGHAPASDGVEYEYATGLARGALSCLPGDNVGILDDDKARTTDHTWVMYRRRTAAGNVSKFANWEVWRALAVVELKRGYSKWNLTRTDGGRGNLDAYSLDLAGDENGPLAQVLMDAFAHAAPGVASLGELPPLIPLAVVQCRTDEAASEPVEVGWVHGNLVTPEACGERFRYNVDAYGPMYPQDLLNGPALAAYLDVMTKGLQVARRWLQRLQVARVLPVPHPLSGRILRFGERCDDPNLTRIENPTLLATPVLKYCADGNRHYRVHQGELFRASVDLNRLRSTLTNRNRVYWCPDAYPGDSGSSREVLIKVTSQACFNLLIPTFNAYLYTVSDFELDYMSDVRVALSGSLYGFSRTTDNCGLVQLLPDLRSMGYLSIPDASGPAAPDWGALWSAFADLVREVLVPLARVEIVHTDLRTGHDVTTNLLYNEESKSMRLIDLDSLCSFPVLSCLPAVADRRYLSPEWLPGPLRRANAMGFVLGQVLCAGEVWIGAIRHHDVDANDTVRRALPRRRPFPPAAIDAEGGSSVAHDPGGADGSGSVFGGRAYDAEGNFVAVVNEDLINAALEGYQAKFDRLSATRS